jgi:hypothetical protein
MMAFDDFNEITLKHSTVMHAEEELSHAGNPNKLSTAICWHGFMHLYGQAVLLADQLPTSFPF